MKKIMPKIDLKEARGGATAIEYGLISIYRKRGAASLRGAWGERVPSGFISKKIVELSLKLKFEADANSSDVSASLVDLA